MSPKSLDSTGTRRPADCRVLPFKHHLRCDQSLQRRGSRRECSIPAVIVNVRVEVFSAMVIAIPALGVVDGTAPAGTVDQGSDVCANRRRLTPTRPVGAVPGQGRLVIMETSRNCQPVRESDQGRNSNEPRTTTSTVIKQAPGTAHSPHHPSRLSRSANEAVVTVRGGGLPLAGLRSVLVAMASALDALYGSER
jgi:hypothetical protein